MATKIRLARGGAKKSPFYRVVVADARSPRDGKFIEKIGTYSPILSKDDAGRVVFQKDRVEYWIGTGAEPTEKVEKLLIAAGLLAAKPVKAKKEAA